MKSSPSSHTSCAASMKLLGDYWTLRIVDALQSGPLRYCEVQRATDNLNPVTLTARLKKLEDAGLVSRHEEDEVAVSYCLTPRGNDALPVLKAIDTFQAKQSLA